jgi:HEAT repeat protein
MKAQMNGFVVKNQMNEAQQLSQQGKWALLTQKLHYLMLTENFSTLAPQDITTLVSLAIAVLEAGDFQEQWDVVKVLPTLGEPAIAPLINLLNDEAAAPATRWFAARTLGDLPYPQAIQALAELLRTSEDDELCEIAASALANFGSAAISTIAPLLEHPTTRLLTIQSLAQIRHSAIIDPLLTVVDDSQADVRMIALEALSSFHDQRILPVLRQALTDPVAAVRKVVIAGLSFRANLAPDGEVAAVLADCLWDVNLEVCQEAVVALGRLGGKTAIAALLRLSTSLNCPETLQIETIRAFGRIGNLTALQALQQLAPSILALPVQRQLVATLGRWPDSATSAQATELLIQQLQKCTQPQLHSEIASALGQLRHPLALESLRQLLANPDARVRLHAIAALNRFEGNDTQHLLALQNRPKRPDALR